MAKKNDRRRTSEDPGPRPRLHPDPRRSIWAISLFGVAVLLTLAGFHQAGPAGEMLFEILTTLLGWCYFVLPVSLFLLAGLFVFSERRPVPGIALLGAVLLVLSVLGLIDLASAGNGGWLGFALGALKYPFGRAAAVALNVIAFLIAALVVLNSPLRFDWLRRKPDQEEEAAPMPPVTAKVPAEPEEEPEPEPEAPTMKERLAAMLPAKKMPVLKFKDYVPPPLDLLKSSVEKPTTGDLRANANIIKRTLESFGMAVEMGEINIGPKVTRYTLKPAEGVKLSRITALGQDLALALAAHPIRIEAPIPGKSLVGVEVPNKAAAVVRLGSLMAYPDFNAQGLLGFVLGRDVTGEPIFANIEKMPHLLIAGATGSGKSVMIHSLIISLLYKNSPATLKFIMIDPKRVELTVYENIPHLVSPVITEAKKAINVFRWALSEMDRRYELLQKAGSRDITSYNANGGKDEPLPYLVIVVDELADLMAQYGREVEGSIVRLAQMARATGLHLILSTQRPSVEVITGLIKANITSRIALQVASQIDSRTILDSAGAEKLLGGGDMLFISSELSKPKRIQGAYIPEEEIGKVINFIKENNPLPLTDEGLEIDSSLLENGEDEKNIFDQYNYNDSDDEDELFEEAVETVKAAQKASASLLQRRLKIGYARAARLLDIMEAKGIIGPGDGAKPRDVYYK